MNRIVPGQGGPLERRIPSVKETHDLFISGSQLTEKLDLKPIKQEEGTESLLLDGGLVTGGRLSVGAVRINCGGEDGTVSRTAISISLTGRTLNLNSLTNYPLQAMIFRNGRIATMTVLQKFAFGDPRAGENDNLTTEIRNDNVTIVLAMGRQKPGIDESETDSARSAVTNVFTKEELESMKEPARMNRKVPGDMLDRLLQHGNFIRLDFRAKPGASSAETPAKATKPLAETHRAFGSFGAHQRPDKVQMLFIREQVFDRILAPSGNLVIGATRSGNYRGVDLDLDTEGESVDVRHVLLRTEQDGGENYVVVEKLSNFGTEIIAEDGQMNSWTVPAPKGIGRIRIPPGREASVLIGFGDAPDLMQPEHGQSPPDISKADWSDPELSSGNLPDLPIQTGKYRFRITFRPMEEITVGKHR